MKVLALDTALAACSVAIVDGELECAHVWQELERGHAEKLLSLVAAAEEEAGFGVREMDRIAVTIGPGTFTGMRVGLSAAKGMGLVCKVPLIGLNTLHLVALGVLQACDDDVICVAFDARRDEVYTQCFSGKAKPLSPPSICSHEDAARLAAEQLRQRKGRLFLVGTGAPLLKAELPQAEIADAPAQPDARHLARFAAQVVDPKDYPADPLYIRAPDAKPPKAPLFQT